MIDKIICSLFVLLLGTLPATAQNSSVFERFFANAVTFSKTFPREKVHLHLDNSSYYQGDTIWFKAYVVTATNNQLSNISKPLYVELLDQLGNVLERHIIKLHDGEGEGHIALTNTFSRVIMRYELTPVGCWLLTMRRTFHKPFPYIGNGSLIRSHQEVLLYTAWIRVWRNVRFLKKMS